MARILDEIPEQLMSTNAAYMREYRKNNPDYVRNDNTRQRYRPPKDPKPFAGCDGEGATKNGAHRFVLLRIGDEYIADNAGLKTLDMLEFMVNLPMNREYVSYFFDYDTTMILRGMPWSKLAGVRLHDDKAKRTGGLIESSQGGWGVWFKDYLIKYQPKRELSIDKRMRNPEWYEGCDEEKVKKTIRWPGCNRLTISDTQTFFQQAFMKTIEQWEALNPEQREMIAEGKKRRVVVEDLDDECIQYNRLECIALEEVMEKMRDACMDLDIVPSRWQGPGRIANAMFGKYKIPRAKDYAHGWPEAVREAGQCAYYGGRFELNWIGPIPGPVLQADITSAYPYAMRDMWCPMHVRWEHSGVLPVSQLTTRNALVKVRVECDSPGMGGPLMCPLPHRDAKGTVCYPLETEGWYWSFEVEQAREQCGMHVTVLDSWSLHQECDHKPWAFMQEMFDERQRLGKSDKGKMLKLGMNSGYGKMAQSVGHPIYSNHVLASYITAKCRAQIMAAVHAVSCERGKRCGEDIIMSATDALFVMGSEWPYPQEKALGSWECESYEDGIFTVQPGVYFKNGTYVPKTRGVPAAILNERKVDLVAAYEEMVSSKGKSGGTIQLDYTRFIGIKEACHRGNPRAMGTFVTMGGDDGRVVKFSWHNKRHFQPRDDHGMGFHPKECLKTNPKFLDTDVPIQSVKYAKTIPLELNPEYMDKQMNDTPEEYPALFDRDQL